MKKIIVPIALPSAVAMQLDKLVKEGEFVSRNEALKFGARLVIMMMSRVHKRAEDYAYEEIAEGIKRGKKRMYLDTDIVLALIKEEDWLKEKVEKIKLQKPKTSVLNIIEARLVMEREYSREKANEVLKKIKKLNITIIPIDDKIIEKSQELIEKYPHIHTFDAVHGATALIINEEIVSTDYIFNSIENIKVINPREK